MIITKFQVQVQKSPQTSYIFSFLTNNILLLKRG